ncbi:MAG: 3'-5' exonuclease [Oscillospiraceae bacterium]|nr:3'-5' exonuclease [Oscillospiraceae bacterium]
MGYVVLDMEWNQAMSSQSAVFNKLPIHLRGEIIQIGAVRLTDDFLPGEEFQIDVKPIYFKRMHYKVEKLTGFDKERLEGGESFKQAFSKFREWCGDNCTFLTWGSDDKGIMEQNIIIHDLDWDWIDKWVNLQVIYNIQTQAGRNQTGLLTAMEYFNIEQTRVAHDALGDAYNTALVCSKLNLLEGISYYDSASKVLATRLCGAQESGKSGDAVEHRAFTGYNERSDAFADKEISAPRCPECGEQLKCGRWINQGDRRYMTLCECKVHGKYLVRLKFRSAEDDTWTVNRIVYKADGEMEEYYKAKAHPPRHRRTRRKKKKTVQS